jgi:tetratricopeptide (TPR) repeat protein
LTHLPQHSHHLFIRDEEAQTAKEREDTATAERLYRRVMKMDPTDPAAPFNLGNVLRSSGRTLDAETAYRAAVRADPNFASAWYNLVDVLDKQRRINEAIECLKRAQWCRSNLCLSLLHGEIGNQRGRLHGPPQQDRG